MLQRQAGRARGVAVCNEPVVPSDQDVQQGMYGNIFRSHIPHMNARMQEDVELAQSLHRGWHG